MRRLLAEHAFTETHAEAFGERGATLGVARYDGPDVPLETGRQLFMFVR